MIAGQPMLRPLAALYAAAMRVRRRRYELHPELQRRLGQPVISVGNISVGGTGKTPAVAHIARLLAARGEKPAILTRGYRRRQPTEGVLVVSDGRRLCADLDRAGDEPLMLARSLPGVAVLVGADRHLSGLLAERRLGCTVHLLDDGFQHVRLARDVDIVLVTPEDLKDQVLPAGRLREALSALSRADCLITSPGLINGSCPIMSPGLINGGTTTFSAVRKAKTDGFAGDRILAVAGIARPRRFFDALGLAGCRIVGELAFADHQSFDRGHLDRIVSAARACGANHVVTTEKDLVRLLPLRPFPMPVVAAPLDFAIEPADRFADWLGQRIEKARGAR